MKRPGQMSVSQRPQWPPKPREQLGYLLDLIASLEEDNFYVVKTLLEQAARDHPPDQKTPRWNYWAAIIDSIEARRRP